MNSQIELDNIVEVINKAKSIGIFTHVSPDGDAIGSSLGLYLSLKQLKKDVDVLQMNILSVLIFCLLERKLSLVQIRVMI